MEQVTLHAININLLHSCRSCRCAFWPLEKSIWRPHDRSYNYSITCFPWIDFRYSALLPFSSATELDKLGEEFINYQLLQQSSIPDSVWESALVHEDDTIKHHRMDIIWGHMSKMKSAGGTILFPRLCKVAQLVLILPHSNAEEERVF